MTILIRQAPAHAPNTVLEPVLLQALYEVVRVHHQTRNADVAVSIVAKHLAHLDKKQPADRIIAAVVRVLQILKVPIVRIVPVVVRVQSIAAMNPVAQKRRVNIDEMHIRVALACVRNQAVE